MRTGRISKAFAVLAMASLVVGAFAAVPAEAKRKKKGCATYQPGTNGDGQPVTVVTDKATADKPVTIELETGPGLGIGRDASSPEGEHVSHAYANIQVDSAAPSANLFVSVAFTPAYDYDLYLDTADDTQLAASAGFGPLAFGASDYEQSDVGSETIAGFSANDCDGYTADIVGATTPGETVTVTVWLEKP